MDIFNNKKSNERAESKITRGDFEHLMRQRKKELPRMQELINEAFSDYDGGMVAIVRVREDENGEPESIQTVITGVSHLGTQVRLGRGLYNAAEQLRDELVNSVKDEPAAALEMLKHLLDDAQDKVNKAKNK